MKPGRNSAVGPQVRRRKSTGVLQLFILVALVLVAALQASTQFFAHRFNHAEQLGGHFNRLYWPWSIFGWMGSWYGLYPREFHAATSLGLMVASTGLILLAVRKLIISNTAKPHEFLHGSARWASQKDIQAAGLLPAKERLLQQIKGLIFADLSSDTSTDPSAEIPGVYVGGWEDRRGHFHYLRHSGPEHVLTYAPTRSGKGVGLVIPTLLSWQASCVITDLKGELWALTSGWRQQHAGNKVLRFEPALTNGGVCWNPLDEIRLGTDSEVGDVQNLATLIVDPEGKGMDSHWQKTSFALLVGVILHVLYKSRAEGLPATLPQVDAILADPDGDVRELWMEMATYGHLDGKNHPAVGSAARDMLDRPEDEAGSVLSTAKSYLALYRDPVVARSVSRSEFRIKDLMNHISPVSLYIVTQPNDKMRLRPLIRILVNMIVRLLADRMTFHQGRAVAHYRHRLLMMLDEFPSLGKLEILQESLAFVAGYGIKCYLICQDINQIKSRETGYGHDESITSNCYVQNAYPPNRIETAEHLSRLTGQTTIVKEQITTSGRRTAAMMGQVSRTFQEVQRPLLTPDECLRMPAPRKNQQGEIEEAGDMVIYVSGYPAIYGKQPLYFKDPVFRARSQVSPPACSDRIVEFLSDEEMIRL